MEHNFTVKDQEAGERLDKWLCAKLPQFSRHQIKALLDGGRILVNRRRVVIAGWELEASDEIEVRLPPRFGEEAPSEGHPLRTVQAEDIRQGASIARVEGLEEKVKIRTSLERYFARQKERRHQAPLPETKPQQGRGQRRERGGRGERGSEGREGGGDRGRIKIYHEDRDLIVVEKRAGLLAVPADKGEEGRENLLSEIHAYLRRRHQGKHSFVAPLHRLDAETSGIMIFALSKEGQKLEQQFRDHSIRREYTAVVAGRLEEEEGIIDIPLEKGDFGGGRKVRRAEGDEGKRAVTEFRVKERYATATLLELRVRTGRTHQIRVHLAEKGFPLLGDKLYAGPAHAGAPDFPRHALHAHMLGFRHPATKKKYTFHSGLPRDMKQLIDHLRGAQ